MLSNYVSRGDKVYLLRFPKKTMVIKCYILEHVYLKRTQIKFHC